MGVTISGVLTSNINVSPANKVFLVLGVRTVDDETINETLEEDRRRAAASEATSSVAHVHTGTEMKISQG